MKVKFVLGTGVAIGKLVSENEASVRVMLPSGVVIKRKKDRDIISWISDEEEENG